MSHLEERRRVCVGCQEPDPMWNWAYSSNWQMTSKGWMCADCLWMGKDAASSEEQV